MKKNAVAIGIVGALVVGGTILAQEPVKTPPAPPSVFLLLSEEQKTDFGLKKMEADEYSRLNKWVTGVVFKALDQRPLDVTTLEGATVIASDDEVLGKITNAPFESKSIGYEFGDYGGKFGLHSLWNTFTPYADKFSDSSAFNPHATSPPQILLKGKMLGYLSVNKSLVPRADPYAVIGYCKFGR